MADSSNKKRMIIIRNGSTLTDRVVEASSFTERLVGLLGRPSIGDKEALLLNPCKSVHTFFMRFPIDIIFLDAEGAIVKLFPHVKPNRITGIIFSASQALECAAGTIYKWKLRKGEVLTIRRADV